MASDTAHLAERIDRTAADVYEYVKDPQHLPEWAPGLGEAVEQVDGDWFVQTGAGRAKVTFAPDNAYGVLDHEVVLPSGEVFINPLRVLPFNEGSEVVFSVRRTPDVTDEQFAKDAAAVTADLKRLKAILESPDRSA